MRKFVAHCCEVQKNCTSRALAAGVCTPGEGGGGVTHRFG